MSIQAVWILNIKNKNKIAQDIFFTSSYFKITFKAVTCFGLSNN